MNANIDIKTDSTKLRVAVLILNQGNATEDQRDRAYNIIDSLTNIVNPKYEKNINFLYGLDKQIALNVIISRTLDANIAI